MQYNVRNSNNIYKNINKEREINDYNISNIKKKNESK